MGNEKLAVGEIKLLGRSITLRLVNDVREVASYTGTGTGLETTLARQYEDESGTVVAFYVEDLGHWQVGCLRMSFDSTGVSEYLDVAVRQLEDQILDVVKQILQLGKVGFEPIDCLVMDLLRRDPVAVDLASDVMSGRR